MELVKEQETVQEWYGLYSAGWAKNDLSPESFSHPAKISKALSEALYSYALERGWLLPGDTVLDPFAGMGGTALAALAHEVNWVGMELEIRFWDMAHGCECTGISKADWVRFYGRWDRMAYKDGRHWCPACVAEAGKQAAGLTVPLTWQQKTRRARIAELQKKCRTRIADFNLASRLPLANPIPFPERIERPASQQGFIAQPAAGLTYRGGQIPHSHPHHYTGNLERFQRYAKGNAWAVVLQGDSRYLRANLRAAGFGGVVSSPPYAESLHNQVHGIKDDRRARNGADIQQAAYGQSDGQLGAMAPGSFDATISSSPFAGNTGGQGEASRNGINAALFDRHQGGMKKGTGDDPRNLDHLPMGDFEGLISSPVYSNVQVAKHSNGVDLEKNYETYRASGGGQSFEAYCQTQAKHSQGYGATDGQLANLPEGDLPAALTPAGLVSSPPFAASIGSDSPEKRGGILASDPKRAGDRSLTGSYGETPGQLGGMVEGSLEFRVQGSELGGVVSSPPYEGIRMDGGKIAKEGQGGITPYSNDPVDAWRTTRDQRNLGNLPPGQLGAESRETFWAAARLILIESFHLLKPGAVAIWVCKAFVRDHQIVDFPGQWRQLSEACGFEFVEEIRAMQVSRPVKQRTIEGETETIQKATKSFFRRNYEKKFPNNRIDWETVVIMRKPFN